MNQPTKRSDSGFTIIEVVLVLAIAALIMLMVFLALPALQRGQRDTQRKDDVSRLQSSISNYTAANRGALPDSGDWVDFVDNYMLRDGDSFADPSGSTYVIQPVTPPGGGVVDFETARPDDDMYNSSGDEKNNIYVVRGGSCDYESQEIVGADPNSRKIAILKALEDGNYECREV